MWPGRGTSMLVPQFPPICSSIPTSQPTHLFLWFSFSGSPISLTSLGRPAVLWTRIVSFSIPGIPDIKLKTYRTRYLKKRKTTGCLVYTGAEHFIPGWRCVFQMSYLPWYCSCTTVFLTLWGSVTLPSTTIPQPPHLEIHSFLPTQGVLLWILFVNILQ